MHTGPMTLSQLIDVIRARQDVSHGYYVYADEDLESPSRTDTQVYVDKGPTFDADNNEVPPDAIKGTTLAPFCSVELIEDVITNAIMQKPSITNAEIVLAFDYYMENDNFMEIGG